MQGIPFVAATAEEALAAVQTKLGPEAVVLDIRRIPSRGLGRLWRKARIEVLASFPKILPDLESQRPIEALQQPSEAVPAIPTSNDDGSVSIESLLAAKEWARWKSIGLMAKAGLTAMTLQKVAERMEVLSQRVIPRELGQEIDLAKRALSGYWKPSSPPDFSRVQVLIGPQGCGKTLALSKWMVQLALGESRRVRVLRLDGVTANTSSFLDFHAEAVGIEVERVGMEEVCARPAEVCLLDLPGVDWRKPEAMEEMRRLLDKISGYEGHLVVNGAYETRVLLEQVRAFSSFNPDSVWLTHLDEESRWSKYWNLAVMSTLPVRYLCAGQNVPGDLWQASEEELGRGFWPGTTREIRGLRP